MGRLRGEIPFFVGFFTNPLSDIRAGEAQHPVSVPDSLGWKELSSGSPSPARAGSPGAGDTGTTAAFERTPERDTPHPLQGFQGSASLHGKQLFLLREQGRAGVLPRAPGSPKAKGGGAGADISLRQRRAKPSWCCPGNSTAIVMFSSPGGTSQGTAH